MKRLFVLFCLGALVCFMAPGASAGLVKHISGGDGATLLTAFEKVQTDYPTTDTLMIDDSMTYTMSTANPANGKALFYVTKPIKFVAADGASPTIYWAYASARWFFQVDAAGFQLGSITAGQSGRITIDGGGKLARFIGVNIGGTFDNFTATTTLFENFVMQGQGNLYSQGYLYNFFIGGWGGTADTVFPAGTIVTLRDININLDNRGTKTDVETTNDYYAINANPENGCTINIENVRSNGIRGYLVMVGSKASNYPQAYGTVNLTNCSLYNDYMTTHPRTGAVVSVQGWGGACPGWDVNIDNCFLRTDASSNAYMNSTFVRDATDTSISLGAISLLSNMKNNLTVTNSAIIGKGAVVDIDTTQSVIQMTNCDLYVSDPTVVSDGTVDGFVTPGYFVNIARRIAATGNHQTTMTRCNLYGAAGSNLANDLKKASDRFVMVSCNDWSPTNAYADGWIVNGCVSPGQNPGYGAMNNEDTNPGIAYKDFTVYNQGIKALNIGSDRSFAGLGVPVELSTFGVQ